MANLIRFFLDPQRQSLQQIGSEGQWQPYIANTQSKIQQAVVFIDAKVFSVITIDFKQALPRNAQRKMIASRLEDELLSPLADCHWTILPMLDPKKARLLVCEQKILLDAVAILQRYHVAAKLLVPDIGILPHQSDVINLMIIDEQLIACHPYFSFKTALAHADSWLAKIHAEQPDLAFNLYTLDNENPLTTPIAQHQSIQHPFALCPSEAQLKSYHCLSGTFSWYRYAHRIQQLLTHSMMLLLCSATVALAQSGWQYHQLQHQQQQLAKQPLFKTFKFKQHHTAKRSPLFTQLITARQQLPAQAKIQAIDYRQGQLTISLNHITPRALKKLQTHSTEIHWQTQQDTDRHSLFKHRASYE